MRDLLVTLSERFFDELTPRGFDPRLVAKHPIDSGPQSERARALSARLNAVRSGEPKQALIVWAAPYEAVTRRGPWVYVSRSLAERFSDEALAFVIAHEMAHHDLEHFSPAMVSTGWIGNQPRLERQADLKALEITLDAGFTGAGALEALDPSAWGPEPEPPTWPRSLFVQHPPMRERHATVRAALDRLTSGSA